MTYIKVVMTNKETGYDEVIDIKAEDEETALEIAQDDYSDSYENIMVVRDTLTYQLWNRDYISSLYGHEAPEGEPDAVFRTLREARAAATPDKVILEVMDSGTWLIVE